MPRQLQRRCEGVCIGSANLAGLRNLPDRHQLVTRSENRDAQRRGHLNFGTTTRRRDANFDRPETHSRPEQRVTRTLIERGVDGLVLLGTTHHPDIYRMLEPHNLPYVLTWAFDESGNHPCVGFDNRAAGMCIANHLLDLGHRRFAMISGITAHNERAQERLAGVREALSARGIALSNGAVIEKLYTHGGGREGLREVLKGNEPPTAVICGNDVLAIGAIAECHAQGLKVPDDISITGFDDMEMASLISPALTTVRFPTAEMGIYAANHLLARLDDQAVELRNKLPTELIVRASAGAPVRE